MYKLFKSRVICVSVVMSSSTDRTISDDDKQQSQPQQRIQQTAQPSKQQGGLDMRHLAILFGIGLVFNIGFTMLVFLSAEIARMLGVMVVMVTTSIFTGYLVVQIADSAGVNLIRKIEGN